MMTIGSKNEHDSKTIASHSANSTVQMLRHTGSDASIAHVARAQVQHQHRTDLSDEELLSELMRRRHFSALRTAEVVFRLCLTAELLRPWADGENGPLGEMEGSFFRDSDAVHLEPCAQEGCVQLRVDSDLCGVLQYLEVRSRRASSLEVQRVTKSLFLELGKLYPQTMRAWHDHVHCAVRLSLSEQQALEQLLCQAFGSHAASESALQDWVNGHYHADVSGQAEFARKLRCLLGFESNSTFEGGVV